MSRTLLAAVAALLFLINSMAAMAAPQYIAINTSSLPSAQGWTWATAGSHAGTLETAVFSLSGGNLVQNSVGKGYGVSGGSMLYQISGVVTTTEVKQLKFTARVLQVEGSGLGAAGQQGCAFGFTTGSVQYDISITPTGVYALGAGGTVAVPGTYDNSSAFHDYILEWTPPNIQRIYRDNVLLYTSTSGFGVAANRVFFGDGTGGANARVEIKSLSFLQGGVVATQHTSWGKVKGLYR